MESTDKILKLSNKKILHVNTELIIVRSSQTGQDFHCDDKVSCIWAWLEKDFWHSSVGLFYASHGIVVKSFWSLEEIFLFNFL